MNEKRRVLITGRRVWVNRWEKLPDIEGTFHQWGVSFEEFEAGIGNFSTAIVELDDGSIEMPWANLIRFLPEA